MTKGPIRWECQCFIVTGERDFISHPVDKEAVVWDFDRIAQAKHESATQFGNGYNSIKSERRGLVIMGANERSNILMMGRGIRSQDGI